MKSVLFFILLVGIIVLAFYLKKRSDAKSSNPFYELEDKPVATQWDSILIGRWNVTIQNLNKSGRWVDNGVINFFKDKGFQLYLTEKYYDLTMQTSEPYLMLTAGGSSSGKWYAKDDSAFTFYGNECNFDTEKGTHWSIARKVKIAKCEKNGFIASFGSISSMGILSDVTQLNKDTFRIEGRSFRDDCSIFCIFIRER